MIKNRREGSPIVTDLPMTLGSKRQTEMIRSLNDSNMISKNGSHTTPPKSPMSKAFDFFPWSRSKKHMEKAEKIVKNEDSQHRHYHKSFFKNTSMIREILADKSNKTKPIKTAVPLQRHNTLLEYNRKNRKLVKNKSLDTDNLILQAEEHLDSSVLSRSWNNEGSYLTEAYVNDTQKDGCENISPKHINSSKHIIFNDDNVVYLIRKEKPVHGRDDSTKDKHRIIQKQKSVEENNNYIYPNGSVIKARLKLAKVVSESEAIPNTNVLNKPSILHRQNSFDNTNQLSIEAAKSSRISPEPSSEGSDGSRNKPRKKLSFREPVDSLKRNEIQQALQQSEKNRNSYPNNSPSSYDFELESQAMLIVRTVGQAFEVCHNCPDGQTSDAIDHDRTSDQYSDDELQKKDSHPVASDLAPLQRPNHLEIIVPPPATNNSNFRKSPGSDGDRSPPSPMSSAKEIQQLRDLLEQQALQTRQTVTQLTLVKEQLISETKARIEAQVRTKHLLQQNRELLEQLVSLGGYTEPNQTGLTSANIALAPQSPLQMFLQDQPEMSSPIRKAFLSSNNNNLPSISQHLNNLGSVNQQLSTLTHQLSGLNQQSQNLQNLQNYNQSLQNLSLQTSNTFPAMNNNLGNLNQSGQDVITQNELYQMNQELLARLQNLNLGMNNCPGANNNNVGSQNINNNNSPNNSFVFANPGHLSNSPSNNNNNFNFLNSPTSMGNLTASPMGTLKRNSYLSSAMDDNLGLSIDTNLNTIDDTASHFIKPLSQVGTLTTIDPSGKVKVIVPVSNGDGRDESSTLIRNRKLNDRKLNAPNVVMLKVTDEAGNVTNTRKMSATPSFITRSTSEKVPNRSQMMSEVQRTAWARHTTK